MKDLKISKELIKAVLEKETETLSKDFNFTINEDYIEFSDDGEMQFEYCIYKFAFKCKDWALKQGYYITSDLIEVNIHPIEYGAVKMKSILCIDIVDNTNEWELNEHHLASSEQQAVFDACEWILSEVNI